MLSKILELSIQRRYFVILLAFVACIFGVQSFLRLPIDAVPDITNNQVQINTLLPSLAPEEIEKQVTFPIETAMSGLPGREM